VRAKGTTDPARLVFSGGGRVYSRPGSWSGLLYEMWVEGTAGLVADLVCFTVRVEEIAGLAAGLVRCSEGRGYGRPSRFCCSEGSSYSRPSSWSGLFYSEGRGFSRPSS
jgi:hypothetical protein